MESLLAFAAVAFSVALACAWAGARVSGAKGRDRSEGAAFGFLFGPLGVLVAALLPDQSPRADPAELAADAEDAGAARFLDRLPPPEPTGPGVLDLIAGADLTPEERAVREREAARSLRISGPGL